ncbi:DoxX family protein [Variovorax saccharolyticus]|uniref:DoxX family protein n=1 Tax=Variovorax saccharolyticus TaxID=3053516 RepID=UPI0025777971|nr:DoxX family protein [Variovorax sp. J22R187]MDM0022729.1 DoxX family protein [Variovorax sp. J22R187]
MEHSIAYRSNSDDLGKLLLRLVTGGLMLFHGINKIVNGTSGIENMVSAIGLPSVLGKLVIVGELIAPILLMLGIFTRPAARVIALNMACAFVLVHTSHLFQLSPTGGWRLELQMFYFATAVIIAILGPGRFGIRTGQRPLA